MTTTQETLIIRQAVPADVPALATAIGRIDEETQFLGKPGEFHARWAKGFADRLRAFAEKGTGAYVLALNRSEIVGFLGAFAGPFERTRGVIYIAHVGIREAWRGHGVGTKLFVAIEDWARAQGAWRLDLRVDEENARGLALYHKRGFVSEGRIVDGANIEGDWRNHLLMAKVLQPFAEPAWPPTDLLPSASPVRPSAPVFCRPQVEDAAMLRRFELALLREIPLLLKQADEVLDEAGIAKMLAEDLAHADRFALAAVAASPAGEEVVGYASAWREPSSRMHHDAYLNVAVRRDCGGRGIGQDLAAQAEAWARAQGLRRLTAFALAQNTRSVRFATALGFRQETLSRNFTLVDGRTVDRLRMVKRLGEGSPGSPAVTDRR